MKTVVIVLELEQLVSAVLNPVIKSITVRESCSSLEGARLDCMKLRMRKLAYTT